MFDRLIPRSEFIKNVATLTSGTTVAQAIPVLISPILTRLYTPEEFGVFALFMALVAMLSVIASLRYELAIMLPKDIRDAINILALSWIIVIGVSTLSFLMILIFRSEIGGWLEQPELSAWLYLIPVVVFFMGIYQTLNYWSTRHKTFGRNATSRISQSLTTSGVQLGTGYAGAAAGGLITGAVLGQFVATLVLAARSMKDIRPHWNLVSKAGMRENLKKYRSFARVNSPHALIDSFQDNGIVFLLTYYFKESITGFYGFAFRILKAPLSLIGSSVYQVFYQTASEYHNENKDLRPMVLKMYTRLALLGILPFATLFFFGPQLFAWVFGDNWMEAGVIASILTPWLYLNFIGSPVSCMALIKNKQGMAMIFTILDVTVRIFALIFGGIKGDYKLSFYIITGFSSCITIFGLWWYYQIAAPKAGGYDA